MRKRPTLTLMRIAVVIFAITQYGGAQAANLRYVRTGKHEHFMRVVFEFQNRVQFKSPEITGKGQFSVDFLDTSTNLPRQRLYKTGPLQLVKSIEFVPQNSNLTATVRLSFPYFILKAYPLPGPDRIVVDAYWMTSPSEKSGQKESLGEKPLSETTLTSETKELENPPQKALIKEASKQPIIIKSPQKQTPASQTTFLNKTSNQAPKEEYGLSPSSKDNYTAQTYLLVSLNVLTGCIAVLFIFSLLKKRHLNEFGDALEFTDFIKKSDESIAVIDAKIDNAFKKYNQF